MTVAIEIGGTANLDAIRAQFPALERRHNGEPVAYFDGPGGTQVPRGVVAAMTDYLFQHNANTHWHYPSSAETDALLEQARGALADLVHASPEEIAFGLNMTSLTYHVSRGLGRGFSPGDEVIVTELDHHGNVAPWTALAQERGVVVRTLPLRTEDGTLDLGQLAGLFNPRTKVLAIGAASNSLGTVVDIKAACAMARQAGVLSFVDAVHAAPHLLLDVQALGCDFLAGSVYKFYGPHVGFLFGRKERLQTLDVPKLIPAPDTAPERMETGTQNHEGIVGAGAAVDWLAGLSRGATRRLRLANTFAELHRRSARLFRRMWDGLGANPRVRLYGPPPEAPRTPTLAFTVQGMPSAQVAERLAERAVFVSHGDFYALTVVERLGLADRGLVRAGCACYTTEAEVDRLIAAVAGLFPR